MRIKKEQKISEKPLSDLNITHKSVIHKNTGPFLDALHIFVLFSFFALAQPLFDILSKNAEFFVARKSEPIDIAFLIFILCLVLPGIAVLMQAVSGIFGRRFRRAVHLFLVATLLAVIALQVLKKILELPGLSLIVVAALLGVAATVAYVRFRPVAVFLTVLCPVILIFPAIFVFNSPVYKVVFPEKDPSVIEMKIDHPVPIIMVVFDEFPVVSLMDEQGQIDARRYPNFSGLARDSYWFRNTTNVAAETNMLIPSILTGRYPDPARQPIAADYPNNLFTLIGSSYELKVVEPYTQLCPTELTKEGITRGSLGDRLDSLLWDSAIVYLHIMFPPDLTAVFPVITQGWKDFIQEHAEVKGPGRNETSKKDVLQKPSRKGHRSDPYTQFLYFIDSISTKKHPTLYFLHILLPHCPWTFLPSGKQYNALQIKHVRDSAIRTNTWGDDEWLPVQAYQRHLLQVGFTDRLLGELMEKLKAVELYERSLVIVTADHGAVSGPTTL